MRKYILGISGIIFVTFCLVISSMKKAIKSEEASINIITKPADQAYSSYTRDIYKSAHLKEAGLGYPTFEKALTGFYNLKKSGRLSQRPVLTIADFDQPSTRKRLYIIDLEAEKILLNTWVAHGQRSGEDTAIRFSNQNDSYTSSLGFYVTGEEYKGAHGRSLKLDGMDLGFNDNARMRSIVIHGAPYVGMGTINALGRLGRSQGCPAIPPEVTDEVITAIENQTVLFINKSDEGYTSRYLNEILAANFVTSHSGSEMD